jgi:hypothetical protein
LQIDLNRLSDWAFENEAIINVTESKAVCFRKAQVTEPLNYSLRDIIIPEGIIFPSDFNCVDQVKSR